MYDAPGQQVLLHDPSSFLERRRREIHPRLRQKDAVERDERSAGLTRFATVPELGDVHWKAYFEKSLTGVHR